MKWSFPLQTAARKPKIRLRSGLRTDIRRKRKSSLKEPTVESTHMYKYLRKKTFFEIAKNWLDFKNTSIYEYS